MVGNSGEEPKPIPEEQPKLQGEQGNNKQTLLAIGGLDCSLTLVVARVFCRSAPC